MFQQTDRGGGNGTTQEQEASIYPRREIGRMWLRDREAPELIGPFKSWADALAYIKDAESRPRALQD